MKSKSPIPEDMMPCLTTYFQSKEFEEDLGALFEEVQQIEHMQNPEKASSGESQPMYDIKSCLLYTSDAADDTPCVDLGGRRIIKKKKKKNETKILKQSELVSTNKST
eukprot:TRINITY_DN1992_c0_g1_i3.p1 TRINITY_DN1992_c0_g1~~TRINITY_DN1992_c0_g1_i3.p1  ORF type:complete len:108 (-),score=31.76 TRINITY_DN1992_c0_g1_i3:35-358(-)